MTNSKAQISNQPRTNLGANWNSPERSEPTGGFALRSWLTEWLSLRLVRGILKKIFKSDDTAPVIIQPDVKSAVPAPQTAVGVSKQVFNGILIHPIITEKSSLLQSQNQYVFAVKSEANKISIAKAVESVYGVKPAAVRVSWAAGKTRIRGRRRGQTADWKKAVVTLPQGKTITVQEGV